MADVFTEQQSVIVEAEDEYDAEERANELLEIGEGDVVDHHRKFRTDVVETNVEDTYDDYGEEEYSDLP